MTRQHLVILLQSFHDGLQAFSLSQAQMLTLGMQAGVAKNSAFLHAVRGHSVGALDEAIRTLSGSDDEVIELDAGDDALREGVPERYSAPTPGDGVEPWSQPSASTETQSSPPPVPRPVDADAHGTTQLPVLCASPILNTAGTLLMAAADEDAVKYLIASSLAQLWRAAYLDADVADVETEAPRENHFEERVRRAFRVEFDAARDLVPPAGWTFEPLGHGTGIKQPLLMQAHVAIQLAEQRRIGNWSGTGAGKTVSAVLGARMIGAGFGEGVVLVVCPNNTLDGWKNTILNCYPDSRISTGRLDPTWEHGEGPRWMVINYDALSQHDSADRVAELLAREDIRLDMVAIDEIHMVKHRGANGRDDNPVESKRRAHLKSILVRASEYNPSLAVLGMSATPLVNDLHEARSVLELISGIEYSDLETFANTQNCLKMHQQYVLAGTRFMPDYEAELDEAEVQVDCDNLVSEIVALGRTPHPAAVEKVLLAAKMPVIVQECLAAAESGKRTFVYSHYVEGFVDVIRGHLESVGLKVGVFTGEDKDGLAGFTGTCSDGTAVLDENRVDVLIGSSAISTGVDGLQHVTDRLVFAVLPWTAAEKEQVVGRVHRTGQRSSKVRVTTPVTIAASHLVTEGDTETPWSWCQRRLSILNFKQSVADAVLEGVIAESLTISPTKASENILSWIHRLDQEGDYQVERQPMSLAA